MKPIVSACRCEDWDFKAALKGLLKPLGGVERFVEKGERVLIKPNVNIATKKPGVNTNPRVVEALINLLNKVGAGEVAIGEGSGVESITSESLKEAGYKEVASSTGATLINFDEEAKVIVPIPDGRVLKNLEVPKPLLEYDALVNVPVLKTNICTIITASVKNLLGVASRKYKVKAHLAGLSEALADIHKVVRPRLNVLDATVCMEGLGPISGDPRRVDMLLAGDQAVALDSVAATMIGADPWEIRHLRFAHEDGLGVINMDEINIIGMDLEKEKLRFRLPPRTPPHFPGVNLMLGENCGDCIGAYAVALTRMEKRGLLNTLNGATVVMGRNVKPPRGKFIAIGRCAEPHKDSASCYVPGCPPTGLLIGDLVKLRLGVDERPSRYLEIWTDLIREIESERENG
ncbi:MAG: DUF362 domain-containing protein [Candidatus Bathyarchaeia archaeon]